LGLPQQLGYTPALLGTGKWALLFGAYSCLPLLNAYYHWYELTGIPVGASAEVSIVLVLLVGFRINRPKDRGGEAAKFWAPLVNASRNLAVKIRALHQPCENDPQLIRNLIVAFCFGLKDHLRNEAELKRLPGFENDDSTPGHLPIFIVTQLYDVFRRWRSEGTLTDQQLWVLDSEARELLEVCGGCERIKNTMVSISWRSFTSQCILVSLLLLPWGLVEEFGGLTVVLTVLISYFVIAGEAIARHVETPFGREVDQLDLDNICMAIDRSVSEVLMGDQ